MKTPFPFLDEAKDIARQVLDGELNPNDGCEKLSALCLRTGWPSELTGFYALAHEQTGHEEFGFNKANTAPLIIEECHRLLGVRQ